MGAHAHYVAAVERDIRALGYEPDSADHQCPQEKEARYRLWLSASLLAGLRALPSDPVLALRCSLQAADYVGRMGGFWPTPQLGDAFLVLRNALEDALAVKRFNVPA